MKKSNIFKIIAGIAVITTSMGIGAIIAKGNSKEEKQKEIESNIDDKKEEVDKQEKTETNKETEKINEEVNKENNEDIRKEEVKKEDNKKSEGKLNKKAEYMQRMSLAESKQKAIYAGEVKVTTPEMKQQARESFDIYDAELNVIYKELKLHYSPEVFEKIKNSQIQWLKKRDNEGQKILDAYEGGREGGIVVLSNTAELTKKRCYELINNYMQ